MVEIHVSYDVSVVAVNTCRTANLSQAPSELLHGAESPDGADGVVSAPPSHKPAQSGSPDRCKHLHELKTHLRYDEHLPYTSMPKVRQRND